jgi:dTDP-4-dehydrorhamnose 3,5-epimerase
MATSPRSCYRRYLHADGVTVDLSRKVVRMSGNQPDRMIPSIDREGNRLGPAIEGVIITPAPPREDERGELVEIWSPEHDVLGMPVAQIYMVSIRPGKARGWSLHEHEYDRVFIQRGRIRIGLYDVRPGSPTEGVLNVLTFSDHHRVTMVIPPGVWHGFQNVGTEEAVFINCSTHPYNYERPDKFRLPLANDLIPFAFDDGPGW